MIRTIPVEMRACKICKHMSDSPLRPTLWCTLNGWSISKNTKCNSFEVIDSVVDTDIILAKSIVDIYVHLRETDHTTPDDVLEFIKTSSLEAVRDFYD